MTEGSPGQSGEQGRARFTLADALTAMRIPLAVLFVVVPHAGWRFAALVVAGATDLLDGYLARRRGGSRIGAILDPVADKLFMVAAFGVVAFSGALAPYEILGVLLRDVVAAAAFLGMAVLGRATTIPARVGGKAVTVGQMLTLVAFLAESVLLRPLAWATAAVALYAIWDYRRVAEVEGRPV